MTHPPLIRCAAVTDLGRVRIRNEDCVHLDPPAGLVAVADGMGGHPAGDIASRLAIAAVVAALRITPPEGTQRPGAAIELLESAFAQANAQVFAAANTLSGCHGMGTTLLAARFIQPVEARSGAQRPRVVLGHVGDSRMYRYRRQLPDRSELLALTRDHTTLQDLIDGGLYPPEEARRLVHRNYLTRAVGIEPQVEADLRSLDTEANDLFMLCSDGLTTMLEDAQILDLLDRHHPRADADLQGLAQRLVDAANDCGGRDNISVVLAAPLP